MIDPGKMCDKHLFGEHGELHKFRPSFEKGHSIAGRIRPITQIEPFSMKRRHDELTAEMERRTGKKYHSEYEMPDMSRYAQYADTTVNLTQSEFDLSSRCPECFARMFGNTAK